MYTERGKDTTVDLNKFVETVENVCGSVFSPKDKEGLQRASTCVQVCFNSSGIQLFTCDGRDFRSSKILQPVPETMFSSIVLDKARLRLVPKMFEGTLINISLSNKKLNFNGLGVEQLTLPDESDRLKNVGHLQKVDFQKMYLGYKKPECEIMLPLDILSKVVSQFDYRRVTNDRTIVLSTPKSGILDIGQGTKKNHKDVQIGFSGSGTLPVPVRIDQSTLKNLIKTVNVPILLLGGNRNGLLYFREAMSTFEAFILGFEDRL
jgi:hypothetical protein